MFLNIVRGKRKINDLNSALWRATLEEDYDLASQLICSGANVNKPSNTIYNSVTTLLHYATKKKDVQRMRLLINHGANCDASDSHNRTPLHWAASCDAGPDVVEVLINEGANVEARDFELYTPFLLAVRYNCHQAAETLIAKGASIEAVEEWNWSALHLATIFGDLRMMKFVISHNKINIDAEELDTRYTPLHYAAAQGHVDKACLLLDNGADLNKKQQIGDFPLNLAVSGGYPVTAHFLLKRGARINEVDDNGDTALHKAIKRRCNDAVAVLVRFGAAMNVLNREGKTALQLLLSNGPSIEPIARIIIREAVKREVLGQSICEGYIQMTQSCENYSKLDQDCREEIERMRSETIGVEGSVVSFFSIFSKNEVKLAALARNKNIVTAFETSDYLALFRIYAVDLTREFEKANRCANFLMGVEDCLVDALGDILTLPILQKIAAYVEYVDVVERQDVEREANNQNPRIFHVLGTN